LGHTGEIKTITDIVVDQMHQPWRTFATIINRSLSGKKTGLDKLRLSKEHILWGVLEMQETKVYMTYIGYATGVTPPKKARKFKKHASPKLSTIPALPEEPTRKSKRFKRPTKKSSDASTAGVIIRETPVKSLSKKKEKMIVEIRKGIDFLFEVALTEEAHAAKIKPSITNKGTGVKPGVLDVTEEESTEIEAESGEKDEDDNYSEHDSRSERSDQERDSGDDNTQSDSEKGSYSKHETDENESDTDDEDETMIKDKDEGDEDEGMDYTTNQFDDDVDLRMNEPVTTNEGFIQKEGTDAKMTNKTKVLVTSSSHSSKLVSKFLKFSNIPHIDAENVSPMDVHVRHEVPSKQIPTLLIVPVSVITASLDVYSTVFPQSLPSFTPPPQKSTPTPPPTTGAKNPPSIFPNFASSYNLDKSLFSTYDKAYSLKRSQKDKDKDEDLSAGSNRGLEKRKTSKDAEPTTEELEFEVADSNMPQDQEENIDFSAYIMNGLKITNLTQETLLRPAFKVLKATHSNYAELEYEFEESYKDLS
nr:hypothetical protein [Tanacetum cinerariifolium]